MHRNNDHLENLFMCYWTSRELTTQHQRLAEIIEMIHTASLIHDDVLDDSGMRRGTFFIKLFILGFVDSSYLRLKRYLCMYIVKVLCYNHYSTCVAHILIHMHSILS